MNAFLAPYLLLPLLVFGNLIQSSLGGNCWSVMERNGRCTELIGEKMTREECCAGDSVTTAWSSEDLDPGTLFFWRVLGGGVPCYGCKETCNGVQCGEGKKCVERRGRPKCVCAPDCRGNKSRHGLAGGPRNGTPNGPVCGTDGRSYRTLCRLKKRACRRKTKTLDVAYYGHCKNSCEQINCPPGRHCLVDQNLTPHCVKCVRHCPDVAKKHVCGADGVTYKSPCHLRESACRKGRAIPVAYKGRCDQTASCGTGRCNERQMCLKEIHSGAPRCVTCSYKCPRTKSHQGGRRDGPICGSNNLTYHSWCHMLQDACATGYVIDTKHAGSCEPSNGASSGNTVLGLLSERSPVA